MDNVFVLYTCYTDAENEPCIYVSVYSTLEKAQNALKTVIDNTMKQISFIIEESEQELSLDDFTLEEDERSFVARREDGDDYWEAYILNEKVQ